MTSKLRWIRVRLGHYEATGRVGTYRLALEQVRGVTGSYHLKPEYAAELPWLTFTHLRLGGTCRNLCWVLRLNGEYINNSRWECNFCIGKERAAACEAVAQTKEHE